MLADHHYQVQLAADQLDVAIELFLSDRSDVAALTLAGAAEEIFGLAIERSGGKNSLQETYTTTSLVHGYLHRKELKWQEFRDSENYARNAAKHLLSEVSKPVSIDARRSAMRMIVRALANYDLLDLQRTSRMRDFDNWFYDYEVGV